MARSSSIINDGSKIKHSIKYVLVKHFSFTPVVQVMFQQQLVETNIFIQVAQFLSILLQKIQLHSLLYGGNMMQEFCGVANMNDCICE